ncbi:hypothetical protein [Sphingomonas solaris]|nr:hypothetical protein [Sphingomonas solaris]
MNATIDTLRAVRGWAARTFLRPASITLVSRPALPHGAEAADEQPA